MKHLFYLLCLKPALGLPMFSIQSETIFVFEMGQTSRSSGMLREEIEDPVMPEHGKLDKESQNDLLSKPCPLAFFFVSFWGKRTRPLYLSLQKGRGFLPVKISLVSINSLLKSLHDLFFAIISSLWSFHERYFPSHALFKVTTPFTLSASLEDANCRSLDVVRKTFPIPACFDSRSNPGSEFFLKG